MLILLLILRLIHILAASYLIGSSVYGYYLLRPALRQIPPAHSVVIAQRVGTLFTYTGWTAIALLFLSGILRVYFSGRLAFLFTLDLYAYGPGRSLALMIFSWFVSAVSSSIMTFALRPRLLRKLMVSSNPTLADVEKRRTTQIASSKWLERLQLVNLIAWTLAAIAGGSIPFGGLF
jgi:uncharacterized membrane protein